MDRARARERASGRNDAKSIVIVNNREIASRGPSFPPPHPPSPPPPPRAPSPRSACIAMSVMSESSECIPAVAPVAPPHLRQSHSLSLSLSLSLSSVRDAHARARAVARSSSHPSDLLSFSLFPLPPSMAAHPQIHVHRPVRASCSPLPPLSVGSGVCVKLRLWTLRPPKIRQLERARARAGNLRRSPRRFFVPLPVLI